LVYKFILSVIVGVPILWILNKKYNKDFYTIVSYTIKGLKI